MLNSMAWVPEASPLEIKVCSLAAGQRISLNVFNDVGETFDVSTQVYSSAPLAVERAVCWYDYVGGTCSTGYYAW